jgi:hypothetical protein
MERGVEEHRLLRLVVPDPEPFAGRGPRFAELADEEVDGLVVAARGRREEREDALAHGVLRRAVDLRDAVAEEAAELADDELLRRGAFQRPLDGDRSLRPDPPAVAFHGLGAQDGTDDDQRRFRDELVVGRHHDRGRAQRARRAEDRQDTRQPVHPERVLHRWGSS